MKPQPVQPRRKNVFKIVLMEYPTDLHTLVQLVLLQEVWEKGAKLTRVVDKIEVQRPHGYRLDTVERVYMTALTAIDQRMLP